MSTGTNRERLEQNNLKLEDIKTQIQNLPEAGGSGDVKQFATVEEMQADTTAQEGDLAVVYRNEIQNATADSKFQVATFPDTVVLDNAMTDYAEVRYRAVDSSKMFDCWGSLDNSRFRMDCYTESGEIRIEYRSSDGITYNRTDTTGNPVDFGTEIYYENAEMWNDTIGKFIQVGGSTFEGLFKYTDSNWSLVPTQLTATTDYVYEKEFYGQNGVETGTLQNKENLTKDEVKRRVDIWSNYNSGIVCPSDSSNMFSGFENLTTIPLLDTSSVTDMRFMFRNCSSLTTIPLLDTSNVTNMGGMFDGCTNLTTIPLLDTSSATTMQEIFYGCSNLTTIPLLDTSNVSDISSMFSNCSSLTTIPLLDTSSVTDIQYMFNNCTNLTEIPLLSTSKVTDMRYMFNNCTNLTEIPLLDTSSVTDMRYMFNNCTNLTEIPLLDTHNVTTMYNIFTGCTSLTTIPLLDTSSVTNMYNMFTGCTSLTDESLNNILAMCKNATSYTDTKTLRYIGLTSAQANKCKSLSNYSAFIAAGWTTGY